MHGTESPDVEHFHHLLLIPEEEDASIVTRDILNFGDDGVDDARFELVTATPAATIASCAPSVQHVRLFQGPL